MREFLETIISIVFSAGAAYGIFKWLGKNWLDQYFKERLEQLKHEKQKEIEHLRHEISTLYSRISKIHEKEFEILPQAWLFLQEAYGAAFDIVKSLKQYPDLNRMSDVEFEDFLEKRCKLLDYQKVEIREASDRLKYYQEAFDLLQLHRAKKAQIDFSNFLIRNGIFLTDELKAQLKALNDSLNRIIITEEVWRQSPDPALRIGNVDALKDISPAFEEVGRSIQKRLRYTEA